MGHVGEPSDRDRLCAAGGWPPHPLPSGKLRFELSTIGAAMARPDDGVRAALALAAAYEGERTIVVSFGGVRKVQEAAAGRVVREACRLLRPWGADGRLELRRLRPAGRRVLLQWLPGRHDVALRAAARRGLVLVPAPDEAAAIENALAGLRGTRRKMLRLAARDGGHCVWCRTPLTHESANATVDHVRCRSEGGGNALENLVLACAACNHRRSNASAEAWLTTCVAAGAPVDVEAVAAAIRRSARHHAAARAA